MSSDPDAPYKSRLFNFLNRQSISCHDRLGRTIRQVKVAASWGIQVLLYPAYLLVQTGRLARRKLGQKAAQTQSLFSPSPSDSPPSLTSSSALETPVELVLQEVDSWFSFQVQAKAMIQSLRDTYNQNQSPIIKPDLIQGVASLVENRNLVLVSQDNQILDVLSTTQQQQLKKRISWEVANYLYHQHQFSPTPRVNRLPKPSINNPYLLPPVRWFWQVVSWLQTSSVASEINLFGESSLVHSVVSPPTKPPELPSGEQILIQPQLPQEGFWLTLDQTLADLEQNPALLTTQWEKLGLELPKKLPTTHWSSDLTKIQALIWSAIEHFFPRKSNSSLTQSLDSHALSTQTDQISQTANNSPTLPTDPFDVKILIQAALDYFLVSPPSLVETTDSPSNSLNYASHNAHSLPQGKITIEDPWLSWDDLFSESVTTDNSQETSQLNSDVALANLPQLNSNPHLLPQSPNVSIREVIKQKLSWKRSREKSRLTKTPSQKLTLSPHQSHQIVQPARQTGKIETKKVPHSITSVSVSGLGEQSGEISSQVIETPATPVGYAKHPLIRLIEWLDKNMLRVEELLIRIWRKIRQQG